MLRDALLVDLISVKYWTPLSNHFTGEDLDRPRRINMRWAWAKRSQVRPRSLSRPDAN